MIDTNTLGTLPEREYRAGLAEVIKYGAIIDRGFFDWLEQNMGGLSDKDSDTLSYAITRSCEIKADIVARDEREAGTRALLNFGHTFGHAIENSLGYGEWLHGEAVGVGMLMAARLSGLEGGEFARLRDLLAAVGLPIEPPAVDGNTLRQAMQLDKKVQANRLRFVLLHALGDAYVTSDYDDAALEEALDSSGA